jgi:hypothetical protein
MDAWIRGKLKRMPAKALMKKGYKYVLVSHSRPPWTPRISLSKNLKYARTRHSDIYSLKDLKNRKLKKVM